MKSYFGEIHVYWNVTLHHWVSSVGPRGHEELEFFDSEDETQGTTFPMIQCPIEFAVSLL